MRSVLSPGRLRSVRALPFVCVVALGVSACDADANDLLVVGMGFRLANETGWGPIDAGVRYGRHP